MVRVEFGRGGMVVGMDLIFERHNGSCARSLLACWLQYTPVYYL